MITSEKKNSKELAQIYLRVRDPENLTYIAGWSDARWLVQ